MVLPSYTALKPWALTAKSVVNHKANIDPLLTIGEGSMNPDNLKNTEKSFKHTSVKIQCVSGLLISERKQGATSNLNACSRARVKAYGTVECVAKEDPRPPLV